MKLVTLLVAASLIMIPKGVSQEMPAHYHTTPPDQRVEKLEKFFNHYNCPKPNYAETYIRAADQYKLDYRLLPAISIIESTCGQHQRLNNWWGWNSANSGFKSVAEGLQYVTGQLASGHYYSGLTTAQKLRRYNSENKNYTPTVLRLMEQIDGK